jgi:hypothetical protein
VAFGLRYIPVLFAALVLSISGRATTVIPPDFNKLVSQADYIVRAVVKSVTSELKTDGGHKRIVTKVELDVREVISGTPPQALVLEMLGGKVGDEEMRVDGAPKFTAGDEDILFIHGNGKQFNPLVAMMYGRYPILQEAGSGREYVARSNGVPLHSEQEVDKPMVAAAVSQRAAQDSPAPALSPADFVSRIKAAATQNSRPGLAN